MTQNLKLKTENDWFPSVCPHDCPSACSLEVEKLAPNRIGRLRGRRENTYTAGVICRKVAAYAERVHHPQRLTQPLRRVSPKTAAPRFEPIEWSAALDLVAEKFQAASAAYGAESVWPYFYGGTMGLLQRDGIMRLSNALGYSAMKSTFCTQIAYDGWRAGAGTLWGSDAREIVDSRLIILWGCNAAATQINLMTHVAKARQRGAQLVAVDPYQNATAKIADLHLAPRPGTDGALACALMQQLFENRQADWGYLQRYCNDAEALAQHLKTRDPQWAAEITGVPAETIVKLARRYGNTPRSYIRLGIGFSRSRNGAVNVHAVSCLPAVTGAWQYRGGGALLGTGDSFAVDANLIQALDQADTSARSLDMSLLGAILGGESNALQNGPPVKAMLFQNTNPALVAPDLGKVIRGLKRPDLFVCVHEQFMTETAALADVVLPATMFVEHDDIYRSYGQTYLQIGAKVIDPPPQCRSNNEVIVELGKRLGVQHASFALSAPQIIDHTLAASNYPPRADFTHQHFLDCAPAFDRAHFLDGFGWPDKKFRFKPDWAALGAAGKDMPSLPDHWDVIDNTSAEYPLRLVVAPARGYLNSTFNTSPSSIRHEKIPQLKIHPQTAARYQIDNGAAVKVGNAQGSVTVTARVLEKIQLDTVVVEGIWPAAAFPENIGINVLVSATPAAPNGGAVFHDTAVWVRPVG